MYIKLLSLVHYVNRFLQWMISFKTLIIDSLVVRNFATAFPFAYVFLPKYVCMWHLYKYMFLFKCQHFNNKQIYL